ncbi:alpha/beta hydrolase [Isoptericola halotolerans]|uniref:Serine-threonine protein kinase n=1 Tax=Isoptericola halotolerans TaxID=300560 RepID=A0ABX2A5L1_9MICO|nr:hypothetical protein [Isoptericola halotolerans]NOV98108.1 hypothetical protein [Isoptericola halotolerans]
MSTNIPWSVRDTRTGPVPLFILQFDRHGTLTSPRSLTALVEAARDATDVVMISHGWNNDWQAATSRYGRFFDHLEQVASSRPGRRPYRPVYAGVFWPSAALVMPSERGPDIAGPGAGLDQQLSAELAVLEEDLGSEHAGRLQSILTDQDAGRQGLARLADLLAALPAAGEDETHTLVPAEDGAALAAVWQDTLSRLGSRPTRPGGIIADDRPATPQMAGLDPWGMLRGAVRLATVRQMKDRAGRVGGSGVAAALRTIAARTPARLHLVGHSYGARVVLSALCHGPAPSRPVDSVLLLQAAVSAYAFAEDVGGRPGGYRVAFDRVRSPIVTTRSANDLPLTRVFHLALRRRVDLGEAEIAGGPTSRFAALGGYGPQGADAETLSLARMPDVGDPYPLDQHASGAPPRLVAVDGTWCIPSHGGVETAPTAWALASLVRAAGRAPG